MSAARLIAEENTAGVVQFAKQNGFDIPNDPRHAYEFLCQAWESDPEKVKKAMTWLHPHAQYMKIPSKKVANPGFKNFNFSQYDANETDDEYLNEAMEMLDRGFRYGRSSVSNLGNQMVNQPNNQNNGLMNNAGQLMRDHSKEILTYGAVLLAGIFIGKFLMK